MRSRRVSEAQAAWSTAGQARAAPISAKDRARLAEFKEWHQQAQELRHRAQKLKRKADAVAARAEQSLASDHQSSDSALELHQQALELHQQAQELRHRAQKLKRKADAVAARAEQTLASDHQSSDSALEPCLDLWAVKAHTRARIGRTFTIDFEDAIRKRIGTLTGTVGRYNPLTQRWRIRFDDGTEMMMKEDKLDQHLARPNGSLYADDAAVQRALAADRGEPPPPAGPDPALPRPARPSPEDRLTLSDAVQRVPHGFSTRVDRDTVEAFNANHGLVGNELLSQNASTAFVDPALKRDGPEHSRNHPDHRRRRFHRAWRAAFLRGDPAARQALSQAMPSIGRVNDRRRPQRGNHPPPQPGPRRWAPAQRTAADQAAQGAAAEQAAADQAVQGAAAEQAAADHAVAESPAQHATAGHAVEGAAAEQAAANHAAAEATDVRAAAGHTVAGPAAGRKVTEPATAQAQTSRHHAGCGPERRRKVRTLCHPCRPAHATSEASAPGNRHR